jgi:hypothetical protein
MQKKNLDCMQKRQIGQKAIAILEHGHNNAVDKSAKSDAKCGQPEAYRYSEKVTTGKAAWSTSHHSRRPGSAQRAKCKREICD